MSTADHPEQNPDNTVEQPETAPEEPLAAADETPVEHQEEAPPAESASVDREPASESPPSSAAPAAPPAVSQRSRFRLPSMVVGVLLITLGLILVWPVFSGGYTLVFGVTLGIVIVGIALGLLTYWLHTGRRAQGSLFLALIGIFWSVLTAAFVLESDLSNAAQGWPLYIATLGGAFLLTYASSRQRDSRLISPGLILTTAGLAGLLVTQGILANNWLEIARQWWPYGLGLLALGLIPLAIQRIPRE
jgi:hypothetical protein